MPKTDSEQRVYLQRAHSVDLGPGNRVCYAAGFYNLPVEQAEEWIRKGLAIAAEEYEDRLRAAREAAAADPMMHPAGPHPGKPGPAEIAPEGKMWAQGPKGSEVPAIPPANEITRAKVATAESEIPRSGASGETLGAGSATVPQCEPSAQSSAEENEET